MQIKEITAKKGIDTEKKETTVKKEVISTPKREIISEKKETIITSRDVDYFD